MDVALLNLLVLFETRKCKIDRFFRNLFLSNCNIVEAVSRTIVKFFITFVKL